ncbi:hypothetical protein RGQ29_009463 [Quercus rubra]|uniref:Thioredoxin-like 4, chloroplastic n=1 Tax=Quercus rubra TaxID=3512 RepID=A0AAN7FS08_QUERU|nr:hypothetical protein RGQ29_009463 [Quercus rubra]KAK4599415.1 hypothetical protein RGQ29_009463 [Quercus rubra]KAK4599416.1 hypothetical protein RGQ29_009463 [Quercus rubra]
MQRQSIRYCKAYFGFGKNPNGHLDSRFPCIVPSFLHDRSKVRLCLIRAKIPSTIKTLDTFRAERIRVAEGNQGELSDEDDDLCPAECVREFKTDEELSRVLEKAKETDSLVVVDFYRPSCGSCKYIEQGFGKLCRVSGDQDAPVIFLKHNVIDEYDEQSEVADRLRIKSVPLFHFYKDGVLLEAFPTRDKERITAAIRKYMSPAS